MRRLDGKPNAKGLGKRSLNRSRVPRKCTVLEKDSPEYWERLLARNQLSMSRGTPDWLVFGHKVTDLDYDGKKTYAIRKVK